jgi:hypothetical protein
MRAVVSRIRVVRIAITRRRAFWREARECACLKWRGRRVAAGSASVRREWKRAIRQGLRSEVSGCGVIRDVARCPSSSITRADSTATSLMQRIVALCIRSFRRAFTNMTCHTQVWKTSRFDGVNDTIHYLRINFAPPIYGSRGDGSSSVHHFYHSTLWMKSPTRRSRARWNQ